MLKIVIYTYLFFILLTNITAATEPATWAPIYLTVSI